jgi:hypothetical protein
MAEDIPTIMLNDLEESSRSTVSNTRNKNEPGE